MHTPCTPTGSQPDGGDPRNSTVRFLLAETWRHEIYAAPFLRRLHELGESAFSFREELFFRSRLDVPAPFSVLSRVGCYLQEKFRCGPQVERLNTELVHSAKRLRVDAVVVFRGGQIFPDTVATLKKMGIIVAGYHNDDPLSARYPSYVWRHFRAGIDRFDHLFAYRHHNLEAFKKMGCSSASLLRSFYLREHNYRIENAEAEADVSFIGHWEPDRRTDYVRAILAQPGVRFRLWGTRWHVCPIADDLVRRLGPIQRLGREAYNVAINRSKISLVFLSTLNNDTYTRRCFEIPAAGGFMLAPYTEDLASMFEEGTEADYFRSEHEMVDKIRFYLRRDVLRERIARAGHDRLLRSGHEAIDRARQLRDELRALG